MANAPSAKSAPGAKKRVLKRVKGSNSTGMTDSVSVILPMYNEEENLPETVNRVAAVLKRYRTWEIVAVDDGSTDGTRVLLEKAARRLRRLTVVSYPTNRGRGYALRRGIAAAEGEIVITMDSDLTYDEHHIPLLVETLTEDPTVDVVLGSIYVPGGKVEGVSPYELREVLSRWGNKLLSHALPERIKTLTCILRAYRRPVIRSLDLSSDGKDVHLEILAKLLAAGAKIKEIPATATARAKGNSKFDLRAVVRSHLLFALLSKPAWLFGASGTALLASGFGLGLYFLLIRSQLNPDRPLVTLMVVLLLAGLQVLFFGFIANQILHLQREVYRVQNQNLQLREAFAEVASGKRNRAGKKLLSG